MRYVIGVVANECVGGFVWPHCLGLALDTLLLFKLKSAAIAEGTSPRGAKSFFFVVADPLTFSFSVPYQRRFCPKYI